MRSQISSKPKKSTKNSSGATASKPASKPRSILRWIGGKRQLLEPIGEALPANGRRWIEPFVGSAVVAMAHGGRCHRQVLADANGDLIALYKLIRDDVDGFIEAIRPLFDYVNNIPAGFAAMKARFNALPVGDAERARLFLAINRHGFNGLIRYNKRDELNVSFGKRKSVPLHEKHLRAFAAALQGADIQHADFRTVMRESGRGDIVYCDPPYLSTFTGYTANGFSLQDQIDLAAEARAASARGATVIVSNTDCGLARELYLGAHCRQVEVQRRVSAKTTSRGKVAEVLAVFAAAPQAAAKAEAVPVVAKTAKAAKTRSFLEFFAGGGMVNAGLGQGWECRFANDFSALKADTYRRNWGGDHLHEGDVMEVTADQLSGQVDLAWASSPCQDLSIAGRQAGLDGERSGAFWAFWDLMRQLRAEGRAPRVVILENVVGAVIGRGGADYVALCQAFATGGYRFGSLIGDARHFVAQSRKRVFIVGVRDDITIPAGLLADGPSAIWHPRPLLQAHGLLDDATAARAMWWRLPEPEARSTTLADVLEADDEVVWHKQEQTERLLATMTERSQAKVAAARASGRRQVGSVSYRTRLIDGVRQRCAELRLDGVASCICASNVHGAAQIIFIAEGASVRTRLLTAREAARLMGLADNYQLPDRFKDAIHVVGDGVAAPVVRHLAQYIVEPLLEAADQQALTNPRRRRPSMMGYWLELGEPANDDRLPTPTVSEPKNRLVGSSFGGKGLR